MPKGQQNRTAESRTSPALKSPSLLSRSVCFLVTKSCTNSKTSSLFFMGPWPHFWLTQGRWRSDCLQSSFRCNSFQHFQGSTIMPRTAAQGLDGNIPLLPRSLKHLTTEPTGGPTVQHQRFLLNWCPAPLQKSTNLLRR